MSETFLSIVAPVRDAATYIEGTILEIERVVRPVFQHYEIVLVDDGSSDETVELIQTLQRRIENLQLYCLTRRSGLDVALIAGLDNAIGDFVLTLNIQTDPAEQIPLLWQKARNGSQVACGVRTDLPQRGWSAWTRGIFYRLFQAATGIAIPPRTSDLRIYSRQVVAYILRNNDRHLLLRVLPFLTTHRVGIVPYAAVMKGSGFGRRGASHAILSGLTILISSSSLPLRLLTLLSMVSGGLSLCYVFYVAGVAVFKQNVVEGWVSLALPMAAMFFFLSVILGLLSEYIYMLVQQSGNRPTYVIAEESSSSVSGIHRRLNIVDATGRLSCITGRALEDPAEVPELTGSHPEPVPGRE